MGTVIQLKNQINNSYFQLKESVEDKLLLVDDKIKSKLVSKVDLVQKMTDYNLDTGGKKLRALCRAKAQIQSSDCGHRKTLVRLLSDDFRKTRLMNDQVTPVPLKCTPNLYIPNTINTDFLPDLLFNPKKYILKLKFSFFSIALMAQSAEKQKGTRFI